MRDLWVQEFLREIIVGGATPSDLAGSFIVKIIHSGEGGDVEQVARTSKQFSRICDCSSLSLTCVYISCIFPWIIKLRFNIINMQDIRTSELREISNRKHVRFIMRFEPLDLRLRHHRNKGFSL